MQKLNKLLGECVADRLKKTEKDKEDYILEVIKSDIVEPGDEDFFRKVKNDLSQGGFAILTKKLEIKWMSCWKLQKRLFHKYFY